MKILRVSWPSDTPTGLRLALDLLVEQVIRNINRADDLPTYADNTAATTAGLTTGMLYRTSTGQVMVVY